MTWSVYFAGPDVFRPDVSDWRRQVIADCREYGFRPVLPCDTEVSGPDAIREENLRLLGGASAVVANVAPFRGVEMDSGTAFEIGFAAALAKPIVLYLPRNETMLDRVTRLYGPVSRASRGVFEWVDRDGGGIEGFGLPVNLMFGGATLVVGGPSDALAELRRLSLESRPRAA